MTDKQFICIFKKNVNNRRMGSFKTFFVDLSLLPSTLLDLSLGYSARLQYFHTKLICMYYGRLVIKRLSP